MPHCKIRYEPDQLIVELRPTYRLRTALLYSVGVAALVTEMAITYPHHSDGFVRFGGDFFDPRLRWQSWFLESTLCLGAILLLVVTQHSWVSVERQEIRFTSTQLIYRRRPFWLFRTKRYDMHEIRWPYYVSGGIAFQYRDDRRRIGEGIFRPEAQNIAEALLKQFPQFAPTWSRFPEAPPEPFPNAPLSLFPK